VIYTLKSVGTQNNQNTSKTNQLMKIFLGLFFALLLTAKTFAQDIIIKDIAIIAMTSNTLIKQQSLLIQNGKIAKIGKFNELSNSKQTIIIEGKGKYVMPGLADMHVHLPEADKIDQVLLSNIAAGVTQIRIMNSKTPQSELREKLKNDPQRISPTIHFSHFIRRNETFTAAQADSLMVQIKKGSNDFIKLLSLSDEQTYDNLSQSAMKYNVTFCGHYPVYQNNNKSVPVDFEKVIKSNFKSIEHLGGYTALQNKEQLNQAIQLTKEYKIFNCPTLDWDIMAYDLQYPDAYKNRLTYQFLPSKFSQKWEVDYKAAISKAGGAEKVIETKDKNILKFEAKLQILKLLYDNNCLLLIGGDAGNSFQADGFNIYEEMINWSKAGIDNYTILKSATVTPSQFFNESDKWGTIELGKNAEVIILDKNPLDDIKNITTIQTTIVRGKIFKNKELIKQL
jgi:hypothetical protein